MCLEDHETILHKHVTIPTQILLRNERSHLTKVIKITFRKEEGLLKHSVNVIHLSFPYISFFSMTEHQKAALKCHWLFTINYIIKIWKQRNQYYYFAV